MRSVELFAGAGGLALGTHKAGFRHEAVIEWNKNACETIRFNQSRSLAAVKGWPVHEMDVTKFDYSAIKPDVDLLSGGPPCQPFSLGGKHRGQNDERNMFPEVFRAQRALRPRAVMLENVKGLTRRTFADFFSYIQLQLTYPEQVRREGEEWIAHRARLEEHHTKGPEKGELSYRVVVRLLNAADYGVPQSRERVVFVGFRSDLDVEWSFPEATHSAEALAYDKWVSGNYWDAHKIAKKDRDLELAPAASTIERLKSYGRPKKKAWRTVRDALDGLPDPRKTTSSAYSNHVYIPGARSYAGHTGSPLDEPAKTLKAGVHGVPGGENTLRYPNGEVRYFTVRESARLQAFPDNFVFTGAWGEIMRQLGNAVPVDLAVTIAKKIQKHLDAAS